VRYFAVAWLSLIDIYVLGNESQVTHEVFVRSNDTRLTHMFHSNNTLRLLVTSFCRTCSETFIVSTTAFTKFWCRTSCNPMIYGRQIPDNHLPIKTTSNQNVAVLWVKLDCCNFDRRLENEIKTDDVTV